MASSTIESARGQRGETATLADAQRQIRRRAVEFAERELGPEEMVVDFDYDGWRKCAEFGVMAVVVPRQYGGQEQSLNEFVAVMEGLGRGTARRGVLFAISAHVFGSLEPIRAAGTERQKQKYLPKLASGEWIAAHGVTEPQGGSDVAQMRTTARQDNGTWVIDGVKHLITCGVAADLHLVYGQSQEHGLTCFLVDPGTPAFRCS